MISCFNLKIQDPKTLKNTTIKTILFLLIVPVITVNLQGCSRTQTKKDDIANVNSNNYSNQTGVTPVPAEAILTPNANITPAPGNTPATVSTPAPAYTPATASASSAPTPPASNQTSGAIPAPIPTPALTDDSGEENIKVQLEKKAYELAKNNKVELVDGYKIISVTAGNLNSDEYPDLAVAVEKSPGAELGLRTLCVLIQDSKGSYSIKHTNKNIILGSHEGGIFGDPFQKIEISDRTLNVYEYGGSNYRWQFKDQFKYINNELILANSYRLNFFTGTINGYEENYDFLNGTVNYVSFSYSKDYKPKLIYTDKIDTKKILFDTFNISKYQAAIGFNYLPSLGAYEYTKYDKMIDLKFDTNKALDVIRNTIYPDMEKVVIPWTVETKANYSSLIFYTVPDYYYKKGNNRLYYSSLQDRNGKLEHTIIFRDENDKFTFYRVDDLTGEVKK